MTSELQALRKHNALKPINWDTMRQSLIDSKMVIDRAAVRGIDKVPVLTTYATAKTGKMLHPIPSGEQYLRQLWWPEAGENAIEIPYGPVSKEKGLA